MSNYVLSADAILYAAAVAGVRSFTGLPNVFGGQTEQERRQTITSAKAELSEAGLSSMDFDGNETIDAQLIEEVKNCAWARQITGYDLKEADGNKLSYTYYLNMDGKSGFLTSDSGEEGKYRLEGLTEEAVKDIFKNKFVFHGENYGINEFVADNIDVTRADREKLLAAGASAELVELIAASISGGGCALTMRRFVNHVEDVSYVLLFNDKATVKMDIFYDNGVEKARFSPVSADEAYTMICSLLDESDFEPFIEDEQKAFEEDDI